MTTKEIDKPAVEVKTLTPEMKLDWEEGGSSSEGGGDMGSVPVQDAMLHTWCKTCGGDVAKTDWKEDKQFCSKACRKNRRKPTIMADETEKKDFKPLIMRAWHHPLKVMCEVHAIDYPANRLYVQIPERDNYNFNAPVQEFTVMTNIGNFTDQNAKAILEGDVVSVEIKDKPVWKGTVTYDRKLGSLIVKEAVQVDAGEEKPEPRILLVTEEVSASLVVLGNMYTYRDEAEPSEQTATEVAGQMEENSVS